MKKLREMFALIRMSNLVGFVKSLRDIMRMDSGISGDAQGHIDVNKQQFIAYAYGLDEQGNSSWGRWNTKWNPLKITKK